jgi:hypothetical protein
VIFDRARSVVTGHKIGSFGEPSMVKLLRELLDQYDFGI